MPPYSGQRQEEAERTQRRSRKQTCSPKAYRRPLAYRFAEAPATTARLRRARKPRWLLGPSTGRPSGNPKGLPPFQVNGFESAIEEVHAKPSSLGYCSREYSLVSICLCVALLERFQELSGAQIARARITSSNSSAVSSRVTIVLQCDKSLPHLLANQIVQFRTADFKDQRFIISQNSR